MNKILPIYFVIMFFSLATFGQNRFFLKPLPESSGLFERKPINPAIRFSPDIRIASPNLFPNDSLKSDNNLSFEGDQLSAINRFRVQPDPNVRTSIFQDYSNMPIADLSIGYSSNLPIKEFPKDFPSNMSIIDGKSLVAEAFYRELNEGNVIIVE